MDFVLFSIGVLILVVAALLTLFGFVQVRAYLKEEEREGVLARIPDPAMSR